MKKLWLLLGLAFVAPTSFAEEYYIAGKVDYTSLKINSENFNPLMSQLKLGVKVFDNNFFKGVGLELVVGQSVTNDEIEGFSLDIAQHWGLHSTFTSDLGTAEFALNLGYTSTELDSQSSLLSNQFSETVEGLSYGFSYHQAIEFLPNFSWTVDCTQYFSEDSVSMSGCGLGVSYDF